MTEPAVISFHEFQFDIVGSQQWAEGNEEVSNSFKRRRKLRGESKLCGSIFSTLPLPLVVASNFERQIKLESSSGCRKDEELRGRSGVLLSSAFKFLLTYLVVAVLFISHITLKYTRLISRVRYSQNFRSGLSKNNWGSPCCPMLFVVAGNRPPPHLFIICCLQLETPSLNIFTPFTSSGTNATSSCVPVSYYR